MAMRDCSWVEGARRGVVLGAMLGACAFVGGTRADGAPAACTKQVRQGPLTLKAGSWQAEPGAYTAAGPVTVNGLELRGPGKVRVDTIGGRVQSTHSRR